MSITGALFIELKITTKTDAIAWILTWIHLENRLFHAIFTTQAAILAWILRQNKTASHLCSSQSLIYLCLGGIKEDLRLTILICFHV